MVLNSCRDYTNVIQFKGAFPKIFIIEAPSVWSLWGQSKTPFSHQGYFVVLHSSSALSVKSKGITYFLAPFFTGAQSHSLPAFVPVWRRELGRVVDERQQLFSWIKSPVKKAKPETQTRLHPRRLMNENNEGKECWRLNNSSLNCLFLHDGAFMGSFQDFYFPFFLAPSQILPQTKACCGE